jgi:hypothetical protein
MHWLHALDDAMHKHNRDARLAAINCVMQSQRMWFLHAARVELRSRCAALDSLRVSAVKQTCFRCARGQTCERRIC